MGKKFVINYDAETRRLKEQVKRNQNHSRIIFYK